VIETVTIENYKSIDKLVLPLGRVNVFIGENGAGKSNILEAVALAGAAQAHKLDNEFLASRGIRVSAPELMRSAFDASKSRDAIKVSVKLLGRPSINYELTNDNQPYSTWINSAIRSDVIGFEQFRNWFDDYLLSLPSDKQRLKALDTLRNTLVPALNRASKSDSEDSESELKIKIELPTPSIRKMDSGGIEDFIIYSPENSMLRLFESEGQIEPLGINGEGLLKLLTVLSNRRDKAAINSIKQSLKMFSWFEDFKVSRSKSRGFLEIFDQFLDKSSQSLDQRSANEGFLYLAFYFALFASELTPRFFAIDNVDASLNPKLCEALMKRLTTLAKEHDKQVILTTHNPAILDGLDLTDPEHRLFVISRATDGQTRVRRFEKKPSDERPRRLSELFLSGALGGLPKRF
jgi:predicted ATPase